MCSIFSKCEAIPNANVVTISMATNTIAAKKIWYFIVRFILHFVWNVLIRSTKLSSHTVVSPSGIKGLV